MKEIVADPKLVAYCGLYCGACGAYLRGRCPGCIENYKATWCKVPRLLPAKPVRIVRRVQGFPGPGRLPKVQQLDRKTLRHHLSLRPRRLHPPDPPVGNRRPRRRNGKKQTADHQEVNRAPRECHLVDIGNKIEHQSHHKQQRSHQQQAGQQHHRQNPAKAEDVDASRPESCPSKQPRLRRPDRGTGRKVSPGRAAAETALFPPPVRRRAR